TKIKSVHERYEQLKFHSKHLKYLYDIYKLKDVQKELQNVLTDAKSKESDVDGRQMCDELAVLAPVIKPTMTPVDILAYEVRNGFAPNVAIALQIMLTLPITVAT
ncbi:zinc finger MYM-type 1-like, partial [Pelobates cultripes]